MEKKGLKKVYFFSEAWIATSWGGTLDANRKITGFDSWIDCLFSRCYSSQSAISYYRLITFRPIIMQEF